MRQKSNKILVKPREIVVGPTAAGRQPQNAFGVGQIETVNLQTRHRSNLRPANKTKLSGSAIAPAAL